MPGTGFPPDDTDPRVMDVWIESLRKLTPGQKLGLVFEMIDFVQQATIRQLRKEHPGISEQELLWHLALRRYGREIADRVYPEVAAK